MKVLEVSNLTLDPDNSEEYLVVPDESTITKNVKYPLFLGRLDLLWIMKDVDIYKANILPYVDLTEEEYESLDWEANTIYRIIDNSRIVKLFFNGTEYGTTTEVQQMVGNATLFLSEDGVIYTDLISDNTKLKVDSAIESDMLSSNTRLKVTSAAEGAVVTTEVVQSGINTIDITNLVWESGGGNLNTGVFDISVSSQIRSQEYIELPSNTFAISVSSKSTNNNSMGYYAVFYNENKEFVSSTPSKVNGGVQFSVSGNPAYVRIILENGSNISPDSLVSSVLTTYSTWE
jgi:hypothetical protein